MSLVASQQAIISHRLNAELIKQLQTLIQFKSVTPNQAGAIDWLVEQLCELGFFCEKFTSNGVTNLIARVKFKEGPCIAFSGHIDVVPADNDDWLSPPFDGKIINGVIYGRGAADMKGGVAAMLSATKKIINNTSSKAGTFYWLITSDEEGEAEFGSAQIANKLSSNGIVLDGCIVGEPTSSTYVGDTIKNGRRGALSARILVKGKAGHVAYPQNTINAAHISAKIVSKLSEQVWHLDDAGSKTTLQVTGINTNNVVDNLVPSHCEITFNIRYSHRYNSNEIKSILINSLDEFSRYITINWERPCEPYYTRTESTWSLISCVEQAIHSQTGNYPLLSTSGGTSDGRFFANSHTQVIEFGLKNKTIHQINEHVSIDDLIKVEAIYYDLLSRIFINDTNFK
ncbi:MULTISPECIES: succinyl-diaminopimelate desuccinylase [unclassified Pseudoalteromonas]|uniref:succinyl-diaminopimelate desuccinylase n=1 Tax=unclassified Pseudoalteromonas TaxID=194690 RepID=UPI0011085134|nr:MULTISPECIES: succinyl-diaminopimelate desuccinylase [unclassified Pseudoalteromonas]TMN85798.1 succinyl-diaminopimelate desuccinylase [Pseudoalteromonas sp. S410]TMN93126.1 succinyl-diaminopimelate desuccinylase [Pseudoalteromonas sp. S408]TMN99617.1 succinyl-diaminopimelate desuccinylase [Pseudoalteromonas sp. S407]TMO00393.1 succinyl-diaminopimelate desuccinylase [Pseudoalteromonas sp. S409]TMO12673.1 succinyl-diaminopimelate desuccinylase [Pseudoalteromonas sp. S186]